MPEAGEVDGSRYAHGPRGQCPHCRRLVGVAAGLAVEHTPPDGVVPRDDHACPGSGQPALPANAKETR